MRWTPLIAVLLCAPLAAQVVEVREDDPLPDDGKPVSPRAVKKLSQLSKESDSSEAVPPELLAKVAGYISEDDFKALSKDDREEFAVLIGDSGWPGRHVEYLREVQQLSPAAFVAGPPAEKGRILGEWLRQRAKARDQLKTMEVAVSERNVKALQDYAKAGFFGPALTKILLGDSPVIGELFPGGVERAAEGASKAFDNPALKAATAAERAIAADLRFRKGFEDSAKPPENEIGRLFEMAREATTDPAALRKNRPDLFEDVTPAELASQDALTARLRPVYDNAQVLRQMGKLKIIWGNASEMGNALGDTSIATSKGPQGQSDWTIQIRLNDRNKDVDPFLLADVMTHELVHALDYHEVIQRYGLDVALLMSDYQETEMRAFITQSAQNAAYSREIGKAAALDARNGQAQLLAAESRSLTELEQLKRSDPTSYRITVAKMAQNALRERAYLGPWGGINDLKAIRAHFEDARTEMKAEIFVARNGQRAIDEEARLAEQKGNLTYKAYLLLQKSRGTAPAQDLDVALKANDRMIKALDFLQGQGLELVPAKSLAAVKEPPPIR